jgi:DeoR/GlpR family transcriptional regulator of sugar metabolism
LELFHGGATLPRAGDSSFLTREQRNSEAKQTIGRLAAELVADGDQLFLDAGTTCFAMVAFLKRKRGLSVITNSVRLAPELTMPDANVIMVGGRFRPDRMDTVGPLAASGLDQLRGYAAFVGADGLSQDFGPTASDIESANLHRLAIGHARETTLLVDHTKFSSPSLYKIVEWGAIRRIVTDQPPDAGWIKFLEAHRIKIIHPEAREII